MPQPATPIKRNFLTVRQAAERLNVAERTIQHWIAAKQLHAEPLEPERPVSNWIIAVAELERFEKERKQ